MPRIVRDVDVRIQRLFENGRWLSSIFCDLPRAQKSKRALGKSGGRVGAAEDSVPVNWTTLDDALAPNLNRIFLLFNDTKPDYGDGLLWIYFSVILLQVHL